MTGFDLAVEFGCVATLELLYELGSAHPHVTEAVEYADLSTSECRALCKKKLEN